MSLQRNHWLTFFIIASLLSPTLFPFAASAQDRKRKPVVVSFGQPNIWSLEQAHYLLARMHMTNLELQAKALADTDLDPNATQGTRIQILKQLLEVGAQFDQGVGFQNERIVETARFNDSRRRNLITNRDRLQEDSLQVDLQINQLERERAVADPTSLRAKELDAQIAQKKADQQAMEKALKFHNDELKTLSSAEPTGTPVSPSALPSPFDKNRLPSSAFEKIIDDEFKKVLDKDPKLNATTMLDNTVQLQHEIIAKQLTLLRDEVGPGERLVFLELPQSLYTTPGQGDEKMAQTWWHVNGYTRTDPLTRLLLELYEVEWKWAKIKTVPAFAKVEDRIYDLKCTVEDRNRIEVKVVDRELSDFGRMYHDFKCEHSGARERILRNLFREVSSDFDRVEQGGARETSKIVEAIRDVIGVKTKPADKDDEAGVTRLPVTVKAGVKSRQEMYDLREKLLKILSDTNPKVESDSTGGPLYSFDQGIEFVSLDDGPTPTPSANIASRTVRTVDIIPRQSSLNVNDIQSTVKATGILAAFKFLFGFAGQVNFQRQKEQYEQFVHQELYASGFGKGNVDFGWTFGAVPGTNRVQPGVRTTYAALVVPDDADSLVLSARGCYFPRKSYQPLDFADTGHSDWDDDGKFKRYNCGDQQTYIVPIPGGGNTSNFWVTTVNYQPVNNGEFVTVSVRGNNFSSQMGVLVNGIPLSPTVGLAHPHLLPKKAVPPTTSSNSPSGCADSTNICGRYERVDSGQIVFSFRMPDKSAIGIPTITLVGPGRSVDVNSLPNLYVNGARLGKNDKGMDERLVETEQRVAYMFGVRPSLMDVQVLTAVANAGSLEAVLIGSGFDNAKDTVYVNGVKLDPASRTFKSPNLYELKMPVTTDDMLKVTVVQEKSVVTKSIPNPAALKIATATILNSAAAVLTVKIEGTGFTPRIIPGNTTGAQPESLEFVSGNELIVKLRNPQPPIVLRLTDPLTGRTVSTVISNVQARK